MHSTEMLQKAAIIRSKKFVKKIVKKILKKMNWKMINQIMTNVMIANNLKNKQSQALLQRFWLWTRQGAEKLWMLLKAEFQQHSSDPWMLQREFQFSRSLWPSGGWVVLAAGNKRSIINWKWEVEFTSFDNAVQQFLFLLGFFNTISFNNGNCFFPKWRINPSKKKPK